jgi:hypothetical protein
VTSISRSLIHTRAKLKACGGLVSSTRCDSPIHHVLGHMLVDLEIATPPASARPCCRRYEAPTAAAARVLRCVRALAALEQKLTSVKARALFNVYLSGPRGC